MPNVSEPEVRPRKPVYHSYDRIVASVIAAATQRVKDTRRLEPPKLEHITPEMRQLQKTIVGLRSQLKAAERELSNKHKARVSDSCGSENGKLELTYEERRRLENVPERGYQERVRRVQQAKVKALLDTIDMTPTQAKAYFLKLEDQLASI